MNFVAIMNIVLVILVVLEFIRFRKNLLIHFSNNNFPIGLVIINLANYYIWGI